MRIQGAIRGAVLGALLLAAVPAGASAAAQPCSWYASPTGKTNNTGRSPGSPLPLWSVMAKPVAGDVVCFEAGAYPVANPLYLTHSGTASAPIVYRGYGGTATFRRTPGGSPQQLFRVGTGTRFVEIDDLTLDGANVAQNGIECAGTDHLRVTGVRVLNTGAGGIVAVGCDYVTVDRSLVWHVGYDVGFSSGISLVSSPSVDGAAGFHSVITNNVIGGVDDNSTRLSDGNGIIVDRGGSRTPPVLVANNLVYMNFGRCLSAFLTAHVWDVNNTCYKNGLREPGTPWGTGEIAFNRCKGCFAINNVVDAWTYSNPYRVEARSKVTFAANVYHGGARNIVPGAVARDPHQLREDDPGFVAPPAVDPTAPHQWLNAPTAWSIGASFTLRGRSPLVDAGVDPHTLPALTADLRQGFDAAMSKDLAGNPRVRGAGWDIGAYEQ